MTYHPEYKENIRKARRKKKKTECSVIRRDPYRGCGICGSENIAEQGVKFCNICGREIAYLEIMEGWRRKAGASLNCKCIKKWTDIRGKTHSYRDIRSVSVKKCLDCGAVCSDYCPNCKNKEGWSSRKCWSTWNGKLFCQTCGYKNYIG